ncbi:MAG: hypothetical protein ACRC8Y_08055 [Chroococcales cyanobacterium]
MYRNSGICPLLYRSPSEAIARIKPARVRSRFKSYHYYPGVLSPGVREGDRLSSRDIRPQIR